jgi:hypothetical protein
VSGLPLLVVNEKFLLVLRKWLSNVSVLLSICCGTTIDCYEECEQAPRERRYAGMTACWRVDLDTESGMQHSRPKSGRSLKARRKLPSQKSTLFSTPGWAHLREGGGNSEAVKPRSVPSCDDVKQEQSVPRSDWNESLSAAFAGAQRQYELQGSEASAVDDARFEREIQEHFMSMTDVVESVMKDVCVCDCHLSWGDDINYASFENADDICLLCGCFERW